MGWKSLLGNTLLVCVSILVACLIVEVLLGNTFKLDFTGRGANYAFYQYDARLGWSNQPLASGILSREEFRTAVENNALAMRDKHRTPQSDIPRIAVLGDSFTWGFGVEAKERYTDIAETALEKHKIEVWNFGVSGYGPIQYLLQIEDIVRLRPKAVLIGFCLRNDWHDNLFWERYGYYAPYAVNNNGSLEIQGYPIPNNKKFGDHHTLKIEEFLRFLHANSKIYALLHERLNIQYASGPQAGLDGYGENDIYRPDAPKRAEAIAINALILKEIKSRLDQAGIPLLLLFASTKMEYGTPKPGFDPKAAREALLATATALEIPCLDPTDQLGLEDFFERDGHWNRAGHAKVAALLAPWLETKLGLQNQ